MRNIIYNVGDLSIDETSIRGNKCTYSLYNIGNVEIINASFIGNKTDYCSGICNAETGVIDIKNAYMTGYTTNNSSSIYTTGTSQTKIYNIYYTLFIYRISLRYSVKSAAPKLCRKLFSAGRCA